MSYYIFVYFDCKCRLKTMNYKQVMKYKMDMIINNHNVSLRNDKLEQFQIKKVSIILCLRHS